MDRVAVGVNGRAANAAVLVGDRRAALRERARRGSRFVKRIVGIGHLERDVADRIAMFAQMLRSIRLSAGDVLSYDLRLTLPQRIAGDCAIARLQSA